MNRGLCREVENRQFMLIIMDALRADHICKWNLRITSKGIPERNTLSSILKSGACSYMGERWVMGNSRG